MNGAPQFRDFDPLPLISALNIVLQQHATRKGVRVGKNRFFFPTSAQKIDLGPGIQAVQGFYTSVRPTFQQLMVNVYVFFSNTTILSSDNFGADIFNDFF
jgi:hypothetical protein